MKPRTLVDKIGDLDGSPTLKTVRIRDWWGVYGKSFNETNVQLIFGKLPEELSIENNGDAILCGERYRISTIDMFISICASLNIELNVEPDFRRELM